MTALVQEMRELRRENAELRRQLEVARGQHQPYALTSLPPLPQPPPMFTPERTTVDLRRRAADVSPAPGDLQPLADPSGDTVMQSPPAAVDPKRPRRALLQTPVDPSPAATSSSGVPPAPTATPPDDE